VGNTFRVVEISGITPDKSGDPSCTYVSCLFLDVLIGYRRKIHEIRIHPKTGRASGPIAHRVSATRKPLRHNFEIASRIFL
jgi:hypothetical protein